GAATARRHGARPRAAAPRPHAAGAAGTGGARTRRTGVLAARVPAQAALGVFGTAGRLTGMRRDIDALAHRRFDVAIVGGGVHGAWIALRAARSGLAVALLERDDFAAGTSANSLKILHGGLRYLQRRALPRVRRSLRARREHARWFPHLFEPLPCVMPLLAAGLRSPWIIGPALLANELVSARRNEGVGAACRLPAGRLLSAQQCEHELASLVERRPFAGALWWDGVARDAERLTLEAVIAAAEAGAQVANHAEVEAILH